MEMMDITIRRLLLAGLAMPILYFLALLIAGALYPDFSHVRQPASDLGAAGAPYGYATAFNVALLAVGVSGLAGSVGLALGLWRLGAARPLAVMAGLVPAMPSISIIISGLFPLPSPYHSSFVLLLVGVFTPMVGALALRKFPSTGTARFVLYVAFAAALVVVGILFGVGGLVSVDSLGFWFRIWAIVSLPTLGMLCIVVRRRLSPGYVGISKGL
jgi:hypothetical membrane protein